MITKMFVIMGDVIVYIVKEDTLDEVKTPDILMIREIKMP
jgi:hypothetical protein